MASRLPVRYQRWGCHNNGEDDLAPDRLDWHDTSRRTQSIENIVRSAGRPKCSSGSLTNPR